MFESKGNLIRMKPMIKNGRNSIGACKNYKVKYNMRNFGQRNKVQSSNYYIGYMLVKWHDFNLKDKCESLCEVC